MRYLILGGTGLIGGALVRSLAVDGHEAVLTSRSPGDRIAPAGARIVGWDGASAEELGPHLEGTDVVVNLIGENLGGKRWTASQKERITESRRLSGRAITAALAAAATRPAVLVQASAIGYYGPRGDEVIDETTPAGSNFGARVCVDWERETAAVEALGVRRVVTRSGVVLDPAGGMIGKLLPPFRLGLGARFGSGRQWLTWIHRHDEAAAIRHLAEDPAARGAYNLAAPEPATNAELTRAVGRALHRPAVLWIPAAGLRLALGEMATTALDSQRGVPARLTAEGFTFRFPRLEPALVDLLSPA